MDEIGRVDGRGTGSRDPRNRCDGTGTGGGSGLAAIADQPYILLTLTMLFWSGNMLVGRMVSGHIPPVALALMRWTLALVLLAPFAAGPLRRDWPTIRHSWPMVALLGVLGIGLYNTLVYVAMHSTTVVNGTILSSVFPMLIAIVGFGLYRDRLTAAQVVGIVISTVGALVVLTGGDVGALAALRFTAGDLWILAAQGAYAFYTVLLRERSPMHPLSFLAATIVAGTLFLVPFAIGEAVLGARVHLDLATAGAVVYVAIFPALLAFICFNRGVALIGSNRAGPFFHLIPVFGSLAAMAILGERIDQYHVIGWGLILGGIAASQFGRRTGALR